MQELKMKYKGLEINDYTRVRGHMYKIYNSIYCYDCLVDMYEYIVENNIEVTVLECDVCCDSANCNGGK